MNRKASSLRSPVKYSEARCRRGVIRIRPTEAFRYANTHTPRPRSYAPRNNYRVPVTSRL